MALGTSGYIEPIHYKQGPRKPNNKIYNAQILGAVASFVGATASAVRTATESARVDELTNTMSKVTTDLSKTQSMTAVEREAFIKDYTKNFETQNPDLFDETYKSIAKELNNKINVATAEAYKERYDNFTNKHAQVTAKLIEQGSLTGDQLPGVFNDIKNNSGYFAVNPRDLADKTIQHLNLNYQKTLSDPKNFPNADSLIAYQKKIELGNNTLLSHPLVNSDAALTKKLTEGNITRTDAALKSVKNNMVANLRNTIDDYQKQNGGVLPTSPEVQKTFSELTKLGYGEEAKEESIKLVNDYNKKLRDANKSMLKTATNNLQVLSEQEQQNYIDKQVSYGMSQEEAIEDISLYNSKVRTLKANVTLDKMTSTNTVHTNQELAYKSFVNKYPTDPTKATSEFNKAVEKSAVFSDLATGKIHNQLAIKESSVLTEYKDTLTKTAANAFVAPASDTQSKNILNDIVEMYPQQAKEALDNTVGTLTRKAFSSPEDFVAAKQQLAAIKANNPSEFFVSHMKTTDNIKLIALEELQTFAEYEEGMKKLDKYNAGQYPSLRSLPSEVETEYKDLKEDLSGMSTELGDRLDNTFKMYRAVLGDDALAFKKVAERYKPEQFGNIWTLPKEFEKLKNSNFMEDAMRRLNRKYTGSFEGSDKIYELRATNTPGMYSIVERGETTSIYKPINIQEELNKAAQDAVVRDNINKAQIVRQNKAMEGSTTQAIKEGYQTYVKDKEVAVPGISDTLERWTDEGDEFIKSLFK